MWPQPVHLVARSRARHLNNYWPDLRLIFSLNFNALLRLSLNGYRDLPDSPVARIKLLAVIDPSCVFGDSFLHCQHEAQHFILCNIKLYI